MRIERPLGLSELLAETVRVYGERFVSALGLGLPVAGAFVATLYVHAALDVVVVSLAFTATYAAAARFAAGDSIGEAWAQTLARLPTLLVLTVIVAVPFALALGQLYLFLVAAAWLGAMGFSIPVAMLERDPEATTWYSRLESSLYGSVRLARVELLHAIGVVCALVIAYIVLGIVLAAALAGFADNEETVAVALSQVVLAPFFFLALSVLYFEQKARALSSRGERA
ncbi:MAG TPA: hypothetical protein VGJ34_07505 [Gaiellaceae bacterium]|jgi:hypothetical protein